MLLELAGKLVCPVCLDKTSDLVMKSVATTEGGRVKDGALVCPGCSAWYPVQNFLLELVPAELMDIPSAEALFSSHADWFHSVGLSIEQMGNRLAGCSSPQRDFSAQLGQRRHFDDFANSLEGDYTDYAEMPFWKAVDSLTFNKWDHLVNSSDWILDVGCANGRSAFPHILRKRTVIGFDISKAMIRQAIDRAEREACQNHTTFFVSDGSRLPFKDESFKFVQTYGVLHHLPDPGEVIRDIQRVLKNGGLHLGSENNDTIFRKMFDLMMKLLPIWNEEAGDEPLISSDMITGWTDGLAVGTSMYTSVFLPPHLFNLFGVSLAEKMLSITDSICTKIPGLSGNGGLIIFEIAKQPAD